MYIKTVVILTILITVTAILSQETFSSDLDILMLLYYALAIAVILAIPIWIVCRMLRGRITFQRNDWVMLSATITTLTIILTGLNIIYRDEIFAVNSFIIIFTYSLIESAIVSVSIWIVWRVFRAVISSKNEVKEKVKEEVGEKVKEEVGEKVEEKVKEEVGEKEKEKVEEKVKEEVGEKEKEKVKEEVGEKEKEKVKEEVGEKEKEKVKEEVGEKEKEKVKEEGKVKVKVKVEEEEDDDDD